MNKQIIQLKTMSRAVTTAYDRHLDSSAHANIDLKRVALPKQIKEAVFKIANKCGAVYYGSLVVSSQIDTRRTYDLDFYLPKNKIYPFLELLNRLYANRLTYKRNQYGMIKILIDGKDIADVGTIEHLAKVNGRYVLTKNPLRATTDNKPFVKNMQTLEFEHQRSLNANAFDIKDNPTRLPKDAYTVGAINRDLLQKLFAEYRKKPTPQLKNTINQLARAIILYSTAPKIKNLRVDFENELIKSGMVKVRFYSAGQNAQLTQLKTKLRSNTFDITKDINNVKAFEPMPVKTSKKSTNTRIKAKKRNVSKPAKKPVQRSILFGNGGIL